jgi:cell division transport system ATP-binding protein
MPVNQQIKEQATDGVVRFENVGMRYGTGPEVLRDLSFSLGPASFHFLTGPSGAGKSSLLKLLYLARLPSRGLITLFGRDVAMIARQDMPELRREVGVVFQDFRLLNHLSVFDNVALPLRITGLREAIISKHVIELLTWVGLADNLDARPPTLSGGQQQRVAIARAVISRPRLLLADEPTGNVDDAIAVRLLYLFEELNRLGTTVVIATHNDALVSRFDRPRMELEAGNLTIHRSKGLESTVSDPADSADSATSVAEALAVWPPILPKLADGVNG